MRKNITFSGACVENALEEDSVTLLVGEAGAILVFVVDCRDVDDEKSKPEGLTMYKHFGDALDEPEEALTDIEQFQALVDEHIGPGQDVAAWFALGAANADE